MVRIVLFAALAAVLAIAGVQAGWTIALHPKADFKAGPPVPMEVTVKDLHGAPVAGAEVQLVLTMVDMDHGETKVPAREVKAGVYEAKPKFLMEGKWNIEVRAKKGNEGSTMKQQVDVAE